LADDDGPRADDKDAFDVGTFWHALAWAIQQKLKTIDSSTSGQSRTHRVKQNLLAPVLAIPIGFPSRE
jgi:phosphatidylethanolamine-binding protein (PEBP) family uncharacterized protein